MRSSKLLLALTVVAGLATLVAGADAAGKKDKDVEKLLKQAMDEDYLNVEFDKAESKLKKALDTCGKAADNCSPELAGRVHIAMGTVHGVGQQKLDVAKGDLVAALKIDANAKLIDGLSTPELEAKFKEAKTEVSGGGTGGDAGEGGEGGKGGSGSGGAPPTPVASDFPHTPVPEQATGYPVPIYAEVDASIGATKVIARFKAYGGTKWETLPLEKMEGGFGALTPCDAVSSGGELKYFIIASDESGTPIATAGSMKAPFKVAIRNKIKGVKPGLPGQASPKKCALVEDCPPGLPGCKGDGGKPLDAICDATAECAKGLACLNGVCAPDGSPQAPSGGTHHVISLAAQIDIAYVSDGQNVCSGKSSASYVCMHQDSDNQFFGRPTAVNGTNGISGGLAFGGARIIAGYDYFFSFGLGLGARVGYAIGGPYPCTPGEEGCLPTPTDADGNSLTETPPGNSFLPVHLEGRAMWKFLHPNPEKGHFAPYVFVGGGYGQVNAKIPVTVCDQNIDPGANPDCPGQTKVDAYQLAGLGFITFGGGVTYMIIRNFGISGELKFMVMVPTVGFTISPVVAPVVAF